MLEELGIWWQSTTPETQTALREGSVLIAALLCGHFLGVMVARFLAARQFDVALRLPGSSPTTPPAEHGITPTMVAGHLVRLTIWAGAVWWLAHNHGQVEVARILGLIITRTWGLATLLVAALMLGSLLAHRLIDCLQGLPSSGPDAASARNGAAISHRGVAGAVGAGAYVLVVLVILLIVADSFEWPLTRSAALGLWQFAQHLLIAFAALFMGALGARWARDIATVEGSASPEKRVGQYTAMGIVASTTIFAVTVLLSGANLLMSLFALAVLGFLLWVVRGYLPDVTAGLQLRAHKVVEVSLDGAPWQLVEKGLLTTQLGRGGEFCRMQNRAVLEACMHGASNGTGVR